MNDTQSSARAFAIRNCDKARAVVERLPASLSHSQSMNELCFVSTLYVSLPENGSRDKFAPYECNNKEAARGTE